MSERSKDLIAGPVDELCRGGTRAAKALEMALVDKLVHESELDKEIKL